MKFVASREHTYRYMYILTRVYTYCVPFSINASKVRLTDAAKQNIVDGITFVRSSRIVFAVSRTVSRALKKKKREKKTRVYLWDLQNYLYRDPDRVKR